MSIKVTAPPPPCLTGKQFEEIVVYQLNRYRASGFESFHRPGVHAVAQERFADGSVRARLLQSLPDFQGVFGSPQREAIFDCKVCSQASMDLSKYRIQLKGARSRQLRFMYERSRFGSVCLLLIHWNEQNLKTKTVPAGTYAFPVYDDHPFWQMFEAGAEKGLSRGPCEEAAFSVEWETLSREKTPRPKLRSAFEFF